MFAEIEIIKSVWFLLKCEVEVVVYTIHCYKISRLLTSYFIHFSQLKLAVPWCRIADSSHSLSSTLARCPILIFFLMQRHISSVCPKGQASTGARTEESKEKAANQKQASTHLQADTARHLCMHSKRGYTLEQHGFRHPKR